MPLSYCVGLVYRQPVFVVRGVELSNDVEGDALVKLSAQIVDGSLHKYTTLAEMFVSQTFSKWL